MPGQPTYDLSRFLQAQENTYQSATLEIAAGRKQGHWIWFFFPQLKGLGFSDTSKYYGISNLDEASEYLHHPVLGQRLKRLCEILIDLPDKNATRILGSPDDLKLFSSMTLFHLAEDKDESIFRQVLDKYFAGAFDQNTLRLLQQD